jgi:hypothetical protein
VIRHRDSIFATPLTVISPVTNVGHAITTLVGRLEMTDGNDVEQAGNGPGVGKPINGQNDRTNLIKKILYGLALTAFLFVLGYPIYRHEQNLPSSIGSMDFSALSQEAKNNPAELAQRISNDAIWFHELWVRWLLTDWGLTFFAAGSAVTAAIKNAYSSKSAAQAAPSKMDLLVGFLAVGAVLASTFAAKLHASEFADLYRYGDLTLQDAKASYLYDLSSGQSQADATKALYVAWQDAQKHLEGPFAKNKQPESRAGENNVDRTKGQGETKATQDPQPQTQTVTPPDHQPRAADKSKQQ